MAHDKHPPTLGQLYPSKQLATSLQVQHEVLQQKSSSARFVESVMTEADPESFKP